MGRREILVGAVRDIHDMADGALREHAIQNLTERLQDGKRVGRFDLFDLLDCELNSDRYRILLEELGSLIIGGTEACDRAAQADKIRDGLIERFLLGHPELIEDEAAQIEHEEALDAAEGL